MTSAVLCGRDRAGHGPAHAHGPVDEQVGERDGQHLGHLLGLVEVGLVGDDLGAQVGEELGRCRREPALGVTLGGGGRLVVEVAPVALAVDQRQVRLPRLGHAHHGVIDGGVAVRVVGADDVAYGLG